MIGLWLRRGVLELREDLPRPVPIAGEALVRVRQAGICNTDLEMVRGYYPFDGILGHEFVGVVEQAPPGYGHLADRRVVGEINAVCGDCDACDGDRPNHCKNRTVLGIVDRHGAFAEYLVLPARNLHLVPDAVPDHHAVFTEPLAAALQIQRQIRLTAADRVLVVGDGKLGQLIARTLRLSGCSLSVVGHHRDKLALLAGLGIEIVDAGAEDAIADELAPGNHGFDVAVECTGNAVGFDVARRALRPGGTLVLKSTYADRLTLDASRLVVDEITLVGSRCGPFPPALALLSDDAVRVEDLVTEIYPLAAGLAAFEHARRRGSLKLLVQIS